MDTQLPLREASVPPKLVKGVEVFAGFGESGSDAFVGGAVAAEGVGEDMMVLKQELMGVSPKRSNS